MLSIPCKVAFHLKIKTISYIIYENIQVCVHVVFGFESWLVFRVILFSYVYNQNRGGEGVVVAFPEGHDNVCGKNLFNYLF
jgi:hypothetical protein